MNDTTPTTPAVPRSVRIPADLDAWLTEETARTGKTRTDLVTEGVRRLRDALRSEPAMPEPGPTLVDTVARAIANTTTPGVTDWWETITGVHGSQHEQPQQVDDFRRMARAALAAMPEPGPTLVDTVARALYDHRESLATESWTGWHHIPESWREEWRGAARAALAAMPQPNSA